MGILDFFTSKRSWFTAAHRAVSDLQNDMAVAAVQSCNISIRERGEDGVRAIVTGAALGSFVFDHEEAARRIMRRWPDLDPKQAGQLVRYLDSRVKLVARGRDDAPGRRRSPWVSEWAGKAPDTELFGR